MEGSGMVEARDLTAGKVALIEENIARSGLKNIRVRQMDAREFHPESERKADVVLADLPCSGLGVLGKKPDIRYRMTEDEERALASLQREILSVVCRYVKKGGSLLYSTCTIDRMENEDNAAWFTQSHPEFQQVAQRQIFPGRGDGFYYAKWILRQDEDL
jgi:16S rRNA (cytosine967-C5)-methyltransferase